MRACRFRAKLDQYYEKLKLNIITTRITALFIMIESILRMMMIGIFV